MKKSTILMGILGGVAALLYFISMANYAFPGESAHLMALWKGLDCESTAKYPLMAMFAKLFGGGNLLAPICGTLAVVLVFRLVSFFIHGAAVAESVRRQGSQLGNIGGAVAAVVFMLTPAVRSAATHLEPRMFDAVWALAVFALMIPYLNAARLAWCYPIVIGVLMAVGLCDSALFVALGPLAIASVVAIELKREKKPYLPLTLFAFSFIVAFFVAVRVFNLELTPLLKNISEELKGYCTVDGWLFVVIFSTIPFLVTCFSAVRAFNDKPGLVQWLFHGAMTLLAILAVVTPLSPSALLEAKGVLPVMTSAFAAIFTGYIAAYWWQNRKRAIGMAVGVIFAFAIGFKVLFNFFTFDGDRGAFADETARRVLADLGDRKWFVTDGMLDDHLLLEANRQGKELHLIALQRDLDTFYLESLGKVIEEKGVGGAKSKELSLSLTLGVLPFVQDWFAADPSVRDEVAIWGAPDLWYSAGIKPVPEFLFFGADAKRESDWSAWADFDKLLAVPKGWGSYRHDKALDPVERLRQALRRHLGLVCTDRGVWLQDEKRDDEAFDCYERVLNEIDADNVSALFNEVEMAGQKYARALAKKNDLERRVRKIIDDKRRRYIIWRLSSFYGYIRNPDMFVRLGFAWARSGRPGDALAQIRRAIDFVPTDARTTLLNMMAALYASDNDPRESRRIYESVLEKNANDHDALIGMMRLKLMDGDSKGALAYLERAVNASDGEGRRAKMEQAMVAMMRNDTAGAKSILRKITESDVKDMQAWSMLAAVTMQECDATKDEATRTRLLAEIRDHILPEMERQTTNPYDYYLQATKAFVLMREGDEHRREARDALEVASRARPGSSVTQDLVLGLDISLDDRANAERHAREVLRRNRNAPLANYVMGSLAIRRGKYEEAEAFLRKAAEAPQPNILALNDLAEVLRRTGRFPEAETYVRRALEKAPNFYILHETLGVILLDADRSLDEAEASIRKALELSKSENSGEEDIRLYTSLARVQIRRGDMKGAHSSIRRVDRKIDRLTDFERREFEEIKESVR